MAKYLIERKLPATGKSALRKLNTVSNRTESKINWLHSYVTDDKCYCLYVAPNEKILRDYIRQDGFPVSRISKVTSIIDPTKL